jgi:hypothetical protein
MASRSRHVRHFSPLDERYLVETLGDARSACTQASAKVEIQGDLYKALTKVMEAIDDVCVATGRKREHFWAKSH